MKRDPALISLSHDHHQALFVAHNLTRATRGTATAALSSLNAYWSGHGEAHFRAEEEILFPAYVRHAGPSDALVAQALSDHAEIRGRIDGLDVGAAEDLPALSELGRLIADHVRLEERKLFPRIEEALPQQELAAVGQALLSAGAARPPTRRSPRPLPP